MAFQNKNGYENIVGTDPTLGSSDVDGLDCKEEPHTIIRWSEEFDCFTVNGILSPNPISFVLPETVVHNEDLLRSRVESSTNRKRPKRNEKLFFKLFKFPDAGEQYLLQIHEGNISDNIEQRVLFVHEKNGKWEVEIEDLNLGNSVVLPMLQDCDPLIFHNNGQLSLQERLNDWAVRRRKHGDKDKEVYYHRSRKFESFIDVVTFVLYSCELKDLRINKASQV